jgi:hypothetical protein
MWWAAGVFLQQVIQDRWRSRLKTRCLIDFHEVSQRRWRPRCMKDFEKSLKQLVAEHERAGSQPRQWLPESTF